MRSDLFTHEAQKTSAVFGRNTDLQVVFQGEQACTNGKTVYLPAIDQRADMSDETAAVMRGYIDHEAGHVRHTNFRALQRFANKATALERGLHNAIEDIWLEKRVRAEYPGAARNLKATATAVNQQYLDEVDADDPRNADPRFIAGVAITWQGRRDYGGPTCEQCLDRLPDDLREQVEGWVDDIDTCKSTSDTIKLAKRVASEIEASAGEAERKPESGDDAKEGQPDTDEEDRPEKASDEDDSSDGQPDDDGQADDDGDESDDGDGSAAGDEPDDEPDGDEVAACSGDDDESGDEPDPEHNAKGGVGEDSIEPYSADTAKAVEKALRNEGLTGSTSAYRPYSTAHDKVHHRTDEPGKYAGRFDDEDVDWTFGARMQKSYDRQRYLDMLGDMGGAVSGMRRKLERALMAKQKRDWDVGREHGRLDTKRLASAVAGRSNVFKLRDDRAEMDTAVSILVDMSGSMAGPKARLATQAVIALAEALDRPGIPFEVLGFNNHSLFLGTSGRDFQAIKEDLGRKSHDRYVPLDLYEFKRFDERLVQASGVMWQIERFSDGSNTDGEAVLSAWRRLAARPESRRVMLVLSDGQPASAGNMGAQAGYLLDVVKRVQADESCDVVGVGIMDSSVERFYKRHVVVNELDDLSGVAMDQMSRLLMGERFVVDNRKLGS